MRKIIYLLLISIFIAGCSSKEEQKQDIAGETAKEYINLLVNGKYEDYVAGIAGSDSIDNAYRQQLIDNAAMFAEQMKKEHKGISKVEKLSCKTDSKNLNAQAFLSINFADSTKETIELTLVNRNGIWYMQ